MQKNQIEIDPFSHSDGSNSLSDFEEGLPDHSFNLLPIFQHFVPVTSSRNIQEAPLDLESNLEPFLLTSASVTHEVLADVLFEVMSTIHEMELGKQKGYFVTEEMHQFIFKGIDLCFVNSESIESDTGLRPDQEPTDSFVDSWARFSTNFSRKRDFPERTRTLLI